MLQLILHLNFVLKKKYNPMAKFSKYVVILIFWTKFRYKIGIFLLEVNFHKSTIGLLLLFIYSILTKFLEK